MHSNLSKKGFTAPGLIKSGVKHLETIENARLEKYQEETIKSLHDLEEHKVDPFVLPKEKKYVPEYKRKGLTPLMSRLVTKDVEIIREYDKDKPNTLDDIKNTDSSEKVLDF